MCGKWAEWGQSLSDQPKSCRICGNPIVSAKLPSRHGRPRSVYCSPECQREGNRITTREKQKAIREGTHQPKSRYIQPISPDVRPAYTLAEFVKFCAQLTLDTGQRFVVEPFQRDMLQDHFDGTAELLVLIPKKNGKTTLMAALGLFHMLAIGDAEVVIVASSRDQASVLYNQAVGLVRRSYLDPWYGVRPGYREIRMRVDGGAKLRDAGSEGMTSRMRVLSADANTADGVIPTLVLVDELHRHRSSELYTTLRMGLAGRSGQMVTISTAGSRSESPLGLLRTEAFKLPSQSQNGHRRAASADSVFVMHEWALTDTDNLDDIQLVKRVNPATWQTVARLQEQHDSPLTSPSHWARFACGVWTEGEDTWLEPGAWDKLAVDIGGVADGEEVFLAVRAAAGMGIGIAALRPESFARRGPDGSIEEGNRFAVAVRAEILPPPPGGRVPLGVVEQTLIELCRRYAVREIAYDAEQFMRSAELLAEQGLPMVEIPQRPMRLAQATATMSRLVSGGLLRHDGSPELRAQVVAGQTKETVQGWYLVPTAQTAALIAVAIAAHQATQVPADDPEFIAL
jgi:phage terminase large subunit-like protein